MDLISPDDIKALFNTPFVALYWPMIIGVVAFFLGLVKGNRLAAFGMLALAGLGQAWHMGVIGGA